MLKPQVGENIPSFFDSWRIFDMRIGTARGTNLSYEGNIFVAGLSASGKTTHSYMLAGLFGLTYISGSQIHLSINGLSPVQERKFWVTGEAKNLLTEAQFERVDKELSRIEKMNTGCIFDSWIMPWRKASNGLCIYLASNLESRVMKGIVSRRDSGFHGSEEYKEEIKAKDDAAVNLYRKIYGVDIEKDLHVFDIIIDVTEFIESPTFESSQVSIQKTQNILEAAIGYYLTGGLNYRRDFLKHCEKKYILRNRLV